MQQLMGCTLWIAVDFVFILKSKGPAQQALLAGVIERSSPASLKLSQ